jgi:cytosolic carboxypeptidase protein 2/3
MPPSQYYKPSGPDDKTLVFESRFESGNLLCAIKVSETEYDLVLQNDINTNGNT